VTIFIRTLTIALSLSAVFGAQRADACNPTVAPYLVQFQPDSSSFFYVTVELLNSAEVILGFEHDGDQWSLAEQYGSPGACAGQLDTFGDYTMSILTSNSCAADQVYTTGEEANIAWYVLEAESFCQDRQLMYCPPATEPYLSWMNAGSIALTPNGCGSMSWCNLSSLRSWLIPICEVEPTSAEVATELVLAEDREESSLPWGTFLDRSGLSGTTFLTGSSGASLFGRLDTFAGSTVVEGWHFAVPVPCHNCTQYDVTTVLYYPVTGIVYALDGYYGWDS
jgi:hypothetical protein